MRAALRIALFTIVGPPVGLVAYMLVTALVPLVTRGATTDLKIVGEMLMSPMVLGLGYFVGGIPALLTGTVAEVLARRLPPGWRYRGWVMLSGFVASAIATIVMMWPTLADTIQQRNVLEAIYFIIAMGVTGAFASLVSMLLFDALSRQVWRSA
jgi:hypothetical protein